MVFGWSSKKPTLVASKLDPYVSTTCRHRVSDSNRLASR